MLIRFWFVSLLVVISEITATYIPNSYGNEVYQDEDIAKQQPTTIFIIETPGGGPVDDRCPCLPAMLCPRVFGTSPQDVPTFGELPLCEDAYFVRCCGVSTHYEVGEPVNYEHNIANAKQNAPEPSASTIDEVLANLDTPIEQKSVFIFPESTREDDTSGNQQDPHPKEGNNVMYIYPNVMSGEIHNYPEVQDGITAIKVQDEEGTDLLVVFPNKDNESFLKVVDALEAASQNEDELDEFIKSGSERVHQIDSNTPVRNYKYIPLTDTTEASTRSPGRRRTSLRRASTTTTTTTTESPVDDKKEIKMKQILSRLSTIYKQRHPTRTVATTELEALLNNTTESPKLNLRIADIDTTQETTTTSKPEIIPQTFPSRQSILRTLHPEPTPIVMTFNISDIMNNSTEEVGQKQLETPENDTQVLLDNVQKMLAAKLTDIQNELTQKQSKVEPTTEKTETTVSNNLKVHPVTVVEATSIPPPSPRGNRRYRKGYTSTTALPETTLYTVKSKTRASFKSRTRYFKTTTDTPKVLSTEKYHSRFRNIETTTGIPEGSVSPTFRSRFRKFETSIAPETTTTTITQSRFRNIDTTTSVPEGTGPTTLRSRFRNTQTTAGGETTVLPTFQSRFRIVETNSTAEVTALPVFHSRSRNSQTTTVVPEIITPVHRLRSSRTTSEPELSVPPTQSPRQHLAAELTMNINSNAQKNNKEFKPSVLLSVYDSEEDEEDDHREFLRQGRSAFKDPTDADLQSGFMPINGVRPIRVIGPIPKGYVQFEEDGLNLDLPDNKKKDAAFSK